MNSDFRPTKAGSAFRPETGKLYIFKSGSVQVMTAWPKPMAWEKTHSKPFWRHCRPDIRIPYGDLENGKRGSRIHKNKEDDQEMDEMLLKMYALFEMSPTSGVVRKARFRENMVEWAKLIPREIRQLVGRYPKRQWHMLSFLARCGDAAKDLSASNPALAFMLASNWVFHKPAVKWPMRASRSLLRKKQCDILPWLGFPGTESARKVIGKIRYPSIRILPLLYLRQAMFDPETMKILSHLPALNLGAMRILSDPVLRQFISPSLIHEISRSKNEDNVAKTASLMYRCKQLLDLKYPEGYTKGPIKSVKAIKEMKDDLMKNFKAESLNGNGIAFQKPPVYGTADIIPITNSRELFNEAEEQRNCISDFITNIALDRTFYVYRVLRPQRCTLALMDSGERWILFDIKTRSNGFVDRDTLFLVSKWLYDNSMSIEGEDFDTYQKLNRHFLKPEIENPATGCNIVDTFDGVDTRIVANRPFTFDNNASADGDGEEDEAPF